MIEEEKWTRTRGAAKHMLAAVVFNESSNAALSKTEGPLLACMGYYYVCFHSAVAMLWLCPTVAVEDLRRVRHSQLKKLVEQNLVQKRILERSFLDDYDQLQDFREYANYNFGSKLPKYEYTQVAPTIANVTERVLKMSEEVVSQELDQMDMTFNFQTTIGDDIGSDLIRLHCGPEVADNVWKYLVSHQLTT